MIQASIFHIINNHPQLLAYNADMAIELVQHLRYITIYMVQHGMVQGTHINIHDIFAVAQQWDIVSNRDNCYIAYRLGVSLLCRRYVGTDRGIILFGQMFQQENNHLHLSLHSVGLNPPGTYRSYILDAIIADNNGSIFPQRSYYDVNFFLRQLT